MEGRVASSRIFHPGVGRGLSDGFGHFSRIPLLWRCVRGGPPPGGYPREIEDTKKKWT